jgi:hypothetical protein
MSTAPIDARDEEGAGELAADRRSLGNVLRHPALPEAVMARPTGINRADATCIPIPIEGREDWTARSRESA